LIELEGLLEATGGRLVRGPFAREFPGFCHDSRLLSPGELFVAVRTPWGDGHDYLQAAIQAGAGGILCERVDALPEGPVTVVQVEDVRRALVAWGTYVLRRDHPTIIAVTGSLGKTSVKEAIAALLSRRYRTFRSAGSQNDLFGLPLALGQFRPGCPIAVLEMACDRFGEIGALAQMAPPQVAVVTCVCEAHLEYLGSLEAVAQEKGELVAALPPDGWAVLNADDPLVMGLAQRAPRVITFGQSPAADVVYRILRFDANGSELLIQNEGRTHHLSVRLVGPPSGPIVAAAVAVARLFGLAWDEIAAVLADFGPLPGRLRPLPGVQGALLLDDSYSAIPTSAMAALDALAGLPGGRRVAVFGDMPTAHPLQAERLRLLGQHAARRVDRLVTCGDRAAVIAEAARAAGLKEVHPTFTIEDAAARAREGLEAGDIVLVKGDPESRMERVVERLLQDPSEARVLLVRQEPAHRLRARHVLERPTWVELDLEAVAQNCERLAAAAGPGVEVMVVLKADAYGHGAVRVAHTVLAHGAQRLGVACLSEAIALREAGIEAPILVLGYLPPWQARAALLHRVTCTVFSEDVVAALSASAQDLRTVARVHLKVDTGMGRLGLFPEEVPPFLERVRTLPGIVWEGIFTHFSVADDPSEDAYTEEQLRQFLALVEELEQRGYHFPLVHAANSAGLLRFPHARLNLVRPGIALYGLRPSPQVPLPPGFRPALRFKTTVAQVKTFPPGASIGYGRAYRTQSEQRIAVLPVGYADGFRRGPQHWGEVLIRGKRAPIVGRVCMDYTMVDVTHIPGVRVGDEVVLIGRQGDEEITVEEVAQRLGTIPYEVVCQILARVPRLV
jgi:alanine racemase